jgi:hypothetical protein
MLHQLKQQNNIDATIYNFRPVKKSFVEKYKTGRMYPRNVFAESIFQSNMTAGSDALQVCGIVLLFETILKNDHSTYEQRRLLMWQYWGLSPVSIYI